MSEYDDDDMQVILDSLGHLHAVRGHLKSSEHHFIDDIDVVIQKCVKQLTDMHPESRPARILDQTKTLKQITKIRSVAKSQGFDTKEMDDMVEVRMGWLRQHLLELADVSHCRNEVIWRLD